MAKRMALIPEDLLSSQHLKKPEFRLEDDMVALLDKGNLPDDMKVKLLGELIMKYSKSVHEPPEPVRVSIANETSAEVEKLNSDATKPTVGDAILNDIIASSPKPFVKFVPMIVEKLKTRMYSWNEKGEFTENSKVVKNSSVVDFFSYLLRNVKTQKQPLHFDTFLRALREINVPHYWIGNKYVLQRLKGGADGRILMSTPKSSLEKGANGNDSIRYKVTPISKRLNLSLPIKKWSTM